MIAIDILNIKSKVVKLAYKPVLWKIKIEIMISFLRNISLRIWGKYKLSDLDAIKKAIPHDKRKATQIVVIDDQGFPPIDLLRRHQFVITHLHDIERLSVISDFDIVICDIKGVGKHFGSNLGGAHLIEEIRRHFPTKYLIAFSGSTFDPTFNKYFRLCDDVKKKGIDISEWVTALDKAVKCLNDPVFQWHKIRQIMISENYPLDIVSNLEQAYIKAFITKNPNRLTKAISSKSYKSESDVARMALESLAAFASSLIAALIKN